MSLVLLGDPMQSLFRFRHSEPEILINMAKYLPNTEKTEVLMNYRSPKQLVFLSNYFAELFNKHRHFEVYPSEPFLPERKNVLTIRTFDTTIDEIKNLIMEIQKLINEKGVSLDKISVLSRTNRSLLEIEAGMISAKIPYSIKYDTRSVLNQSPFKFMYSVYSLLLNPRDIESFCELLLPIVGIGEKFIAKVSNAFKEKVCKDPECSIFYDLSSADITPKGKTTNLLDTFIKIFLLPIKEYFNASNFDFLTFNSFILNLMSEKFILEGSEVKNKAIGLSISYSDFLNTLDTLKNIYAVSEQENEFLRVDSYQQFLMIYEALSLSQEKYNTNMTKKRSRLKENPKVVTLNTVHSFKGKENDFIFVIDVRPTFPIKESDLDLLCVFYVAVTRARKSLILSCAEQGFSFGRKLKPTPENPHLSYYMSQIERLLKSLKEDGKKEAKEKQEDKESSFSLI